MHDFKPFSSQFFHALMAGALTLCAQTVHASAFALHEQNASGLGEFYAGAGAIAEDPSTNWYNPAGLVLLDGTQFAVSGVNVDSSFTFEGTSHYRTAFGYNYNDTGRASGGTSRLVPAIHVSHKFDDHWAVGFSAVSPFGLATSYSDTSLVRYQAVYSELKTIDLAPSVAYKINDHFALGAGFDAEYSSVELTGEVRLSPLGSDALSKNTGSSWGYGWHAGALAMVDSATHLGLNFHSQITQDYEGKSKYGTQYENNDLKGTAKLPWILELSGTHAFDERWTVLGTIGYTHWSSVPKLELENVQIASSKVTSTDTLNYDDSWIFLAGVRYQLTESLMLKAGGGYDQTPTNNEDRDLRLPDNNRWIASVGARLIPPAAKNVSLDLAYAHLFMQEADIDKDLSSAPVFPVNQATGKVNGNADIIGAQLTLRI